MSFGIPVRNGLGIGLLSSTTLRSTRGQTTATPAISLNFLSGSLDSRVTFTRATTATFVGSNGFIQTAAINGPRFDYNPVTLAAKGLLIEEQRVNLLTRSEEFDNASWVKNSATVTVNATTAPNNTVSADAIIPNSGTNTLPGFFRNAVVSASDNENGVVSIYLKKGVGVSWVFVRYLNKANNFFNLWVNLDTGSVGATSTGSVVALPNDWYRCILPNNTGVGSTTAGRVTVCAVSGDGQNSFTGDGTQFFYAWGAQLEAGAFATSYIPTVASTVTRTADIATMTGTNFSDWYNASAGTFASQFTTSTISGTRTILDANDNTANESIRLRTVSADPSFTVTDGGVDQANIDAGTVVANTTYKMAGAYTLNDFATSIGGGAAVIDTSGTIPTVNQLQIGTSAAGNILNGCIGSISYYNTRLSNSSLQAITA